MSTDAPAYDSTRDTLAHIRRVQHLLSLLIDDLTQRALEHDASKLEEPEKSVLDKYSPALKDTTYTGTKSLPRGDDFQAYLKHHYVANRHHPEHWPAGVGDMTLLDLVEMLCDWKAATERHEDGDLAVSIEVNRGRFHLSDQLAAIFENTRRELDW